LEQLIAYDRVADFARRWKITELPSAEEQTGS
jgi:hypothetical protein